MLASGDTVREAPYLIVRGLEFVTRMIAAIVFVIVLIVVLGTIADIIARYAFSSPLMGAIDFLTALQVGFMLAAALALSSGRMSSARQRWLGERGEAAVYILFLLALALPSLAFLSIALAERATDAQRLGEMNPGIAEFPIWPKFLVLTLGVGMLALQVVGEVLRAVQCLIESEWPQRDRAIWENALDGGT